MNAVAEISHERTMPIPMPVSEAAAVLSMIERAARDPAVDVDKLQRLMELRRDTEDRQAKRDWAMALHDAQAEMGPIRADANNPQTRSKYASYPALDRALRPIFTSKGLSLSFNTESAPNPGDVRVVCYVEGHGHERKYQIDMPADGKGAKGGDVMTRTHATGSAVSYGMRYLLKMIFNIATGDADDDGNAAGSNAQTATGAITDEQLARLQTSLLNAEADEPKFLAFFKIKSLETLPAAKFDQAMRMLAQKAKAK